MLVIILIFVTTQVLQIEGYYNVILSSRISSFLLHIYDKYYDPLKEDPKLVEQFTNELNNIKSMTVSDIKTEIFQLKNMTKNELDINNIIDKIELQHVLARERVKLKLKIADKKQNILKYRKKMTTLLKEESMIIDRDYTDFKLATELLQRNIEFDPRLKRKDLILLLALNNLKYLKRTYNDRIIEAEDDIEVRHVLNTANIMTDFFDFADNFTTKFVDTAFNVSDKLIHTFNPSDKIDTPQIFTNFTTSKIFNSMNSSSELEFQAIQSKLESFSTFDEIVLWSKSQNKNKLIQFLIFNGIKVPNNTSHKLVASILADFILETRKKMDSNNCMSGVKLKTIKKKTGQSIRNINSYDELQLENKIIKEIWDKCTTIVCKFSRGRLNRLLNTLLAKIPYFGTRLLRSSFVTGSITSIQLVLAFILRILLQLSKWSSGNLMQPSNTLVAVTLLTVFTRGGIIQFLGTFIFIKFFRQISTIIFPTDIEHKDEENFA